MTILRRAFRGLLLPLALVFGLVSLLARDPGGPVVLRAEGRSHVVIYEIDTLRRDRPGVYGCDVPDSPNIDALARKPIVFVEFIRPLSGRFPPCSRR